jgi:colicin import membrane protein
MQNAQIWKSIEALCDEAEAAIKDGTPMMVVIQSTAPPGIARDQKANQTADVQTEKPALAVLKSQAPPPPVNFVGKTDPLANADDVSLSDATMAEIAAAIDRAGKAPKTQIISQQPQIVSDQLRHDLMTEVGSAVRNVLANELPQIVRHAVSESLYELLTTTPQQGAAKSNSSRHPAIEAKPEKGKVALKKPASKRTAAKKATTKKSGTKKSGTKKSGTKKLGTKKASRKTTSQT